MARALLEEAERVAVAPVEVADAGLLHRGAEGDRDPAVGDAELAADLHDDLRVRDLLGAETGDRDGAGAASGIASVWPG